MSTSCVIIPARLASTRLPRKLLLRETGKPLIQHTYEAAKKATLPRSVCVAADHDEIASAVRGFGGEVYMTDPQAASGTDRIAELAARPEFAQVDILVNVQGDEPELSGEAIDLVVLLLESDPQANMATLATPIRSLDKLNDRACVKVVFGAKSEVFARSEVGSRKSDVGGRALYFSRSQIPCAREWHDGLLTEEPPHFYQHIGLYAYRREFLLELSRLPRSPLEKLENLEQLRVLEAGHTILVGVINEPTVGVDTPDDYRAFIERTLKK